MTTYLLGMDGMDKQIIKENIEDLPNLQKLSIHSLESITPPITVPAWACSFSGLSPDKLESFDFQMPSEDYSFSPVNHETLQLHGFWNHWDGKTVLMDIPGAGAPELNGYSIGGFHVGEMECYPESLERELKADLGETEIAGMGEANSEKERREEAYNIFEARRDIFDWLVDNKDSDVYFTVFRLPDTMMHHTDEEKDMIESYKKVDDYIGGFLEKVGEEDELFVFSDHGAVKAQKRFFLNTWLRENNFLEQKEEEENSFFDDLIMKAADIGHRLGLRDYMVKLNVLAQNKIDKNFAPRKSKALETIDFDRSEAFAFMTGVCAYSGIWINDDRFERGIVEDVDEVKDRIKRNLEAREEVKKVHKQEELYDDDVEMFPDLVVELYEEYKISLGFHPDIISDVENYMHRKEGVLLTNRDTESLDAELIDIAPTLIHLHNYPVPDHMDGKVLFGDGEVEVEEEDIAGLDI